MPGEHSCHVAKKKCGVAETQSVSIPQSMDVLGIATVTARVKPIHVSTGPVGLLASHANSEEATLSNHTQ